MTECLRPGAGSLLSGARLSGLRLCLPAPRAELDAELRALGLGALRAVADFPSGSHPVCCELWQVSDGRLELAGRDQHQWADTAARWALGPWARLLPGMADRAAAGARAWSRGWSRQFGTYHELLICVPGVSLQRGRDEAYTLVLGMITDSPLARWGDRAIGFGYAKHAGSFETDGEGRWRVRAADGRPLLDVDTQRVKDVRVEEVRMSVDASFSEPLLGGIGSGGFVGSRLHRSLAESGAQLAGVRGSLRLWQDLSCGIAAGAYELPLSVPASCWSPLWFAGLDARVSYPWAERCEAATAAG